MTDNSKPMLPPKNVFEREETIKGWDQDYYHPVAELYYDRAIPEMLRSMGARPGDHVLDAGCGPGVHSIRAARYGCTVSAIDLSQSMLSHARERSVRAGLADKITFAQDDLTKLSLQSNHYPFVFSWGVIVHVPDTAAAIDNLCRVVAPGGRLALQIPGAGSVDYRLEKVIRGLLRKPFPDLVKTEFGEGVWYDLHNDKLWVLRFDIDKLTQQMARRGMKLVAHRTAEFTELQWRVGGPLRSLILRFNSGAYSFKLPAGMACTQLLIFEKPAA